MSTLQVYSDNLMDILRQERLDKAARLALAGMLAAGGVRSPQAGAIWAYDYAEALEVERERRKK